MGENYNLLLMYMVLSFKHRGGAVLGGHKLPKGADPKAAMWDTKVGDTIKFVVNFTQGRKTTKDWDKWRKRVFKKRFTEHESNLEFRGTVAQIYIGNTIGEDGKNNVRDGGLLLGEDILGLKPNRGKQFEIYLGERKIPNSYFRTLNKKGDLTKGDYTYAVQRRDVVEIIEKAADKIRTPSKTKKKKKKKSLRRKTILPPTYDETNFKEGEELEKITWRERGWGWVRGRQQATFEEINERNSKVIEVYDDHILLKKANNILKSIYYRDIKEVIRKSNKKPKSATKTGSKKKKKKKKKNKKKSQRRG